MCDSLRFLLTHFSRRLWNLFVVLWVKSVHVVRHWCVFSVLNPRGLSGFESFCDRLMWSTGTTFTQYVVMSFDVVFIHMLMCLIDSRCASICETFVRTGRVCCTSGLRPRSGLELRWGPAARRDGPAGYKGVEPAGEAASRDPTAAGDPELEPRDDCEFKAAMFISSQPKSKLP